MKFESYETYKQARTLTWTVLLECEIDSLPLNLSCISKHYSFRVKLYSETSLTKIWRQEVVDGDGFSARENGVPTIYLNDKIANHYRRCFTYAHELGHILLGHNLEEIRFRNSEMDDPNDLNEMAANIFARDILAPAIVLKNLDIHTPKEIMDLCHISFQSAKSRAERMQTLYQRNKFGLHPLERQVEQQFTAFIAQKRAANATNTDGKLRKF